MNYYLLSVGDCIETQLYIIIYFIQMVYAYSSPARTFCNTKEKYYTLIDTAVVTPPRPPSACTLTLLAYPNSRSRGQLLYISFQISIDFTRESLLYYIYIVICVPSCFIFFFRRPATTAAVM